MKDIYRVGDFFQNFFFYSLSDVSNSPNKLISNNININKLISQSICYSSNTNHQQFTELRNVEMRELMSTNS